MRDLTVSCLWAACPCLLWSAVAFSRSIVMELDSEGSIVSTFTEYQRLIASVQILNVRLYPFNLIFQYMATSTGHTHVLQCSHASVGLTQAPPNHPSPSSCNSFYCNFATRLYHQHSCDLPTSSIPESWTSFFNSGTNLTDSL